MRNHILNTTAVVLSGLLFGLSGVAGAATITVTTTADELDAEVGNGACSLREAIQSVNFFQSQDCTAGDGNDTITFAPALMDQTITLTRAGAGEDNNQTGDLDLRLGTEGGSITITGPGSDASSIIIDGNGSDRVFHLIGEEITQLSLIEFSGLTVQNGSVAPPPPPGGGGGGGSQQVNTQTDGGGILADFNNQELTLTLNTLRLQNLRLTQNTAQGQFSSGGGAYFSGAQTTIVDAAQFLNNSVTSGFGANGGGLYIQEPGEMTVSNSAFINNSLEADSGEVAGGGLFIMPNSELTVTNSQFSGNGIRAESQQGFGSSLAAKGGGLTAAGPTTLLISGSAFENNTADAVGGPADGGGLHVQFSDNATISNTTVGDNAVTATDGDAHGGGVYLASARTAAFDQNTITNNSLTTIAGANEAGGNTEGAGLWVLNVDESLVITNSTLTLNSASASDGGGTGSGEARGAGFYLGAADALDITGSDFTGNTNSGTALAEGGGAFIDVVANNINVATSLFFDNELAGPSVVGGGLAVTGDVEELVNNLIISDSVFSSNLLTASDLDAIGGGLSIENTQAVSISNSELAQNSVTTQGVDDGETIPPQAVGGGLAIWGLDCPNTFACLNIRNSTLSGNNLNAENSVAAGAGLFLTTDSGSNSITGLNNVTITNNQILAANDTASRGGGFAVADGAILRTSNSIIADNSAGTGPDCTSTTTGEDEPPLFGSIESNGYNLVGDASNCPFPAETTDRVGSEGNIIDPVLGLLADNGGETRTHQLLAGSPAIDGGNPATPMGTDTTCETTDQRNETRPQDGDGDDTAECDIGALERAANAPPSIIDAIADRTLQSNDADVTVDLTQVFSDPEEGNLEFSVVSSNPSSVLASIEENVLTISPVADGAATLDVTASDEFGAETTDSPVITVANQAPAVDNAIPDQGLSQGGNGQTFDLDTVFSDPENDPLIFTASSDNVEVVTTGIDGNILTISPGDAGEATVSVTATDDLNAATTDTFDVTVAVNNLPPNIVSPIPDQTRRVGDDADTFDLTTVFADPNEDTLFFTTTSSDPDVATADIDGNTLTLTPVAVGNASIDVTAFDPSESSATDTLVFTVTNANRTPSIISEIPDQSLPADGNTSIDLTQFFEDPDGDPLFFSATSSNPDVVAVSIDENGVLTLTAGAPGTATITVSAEDTLGAEVFSRVSIGGSSSGSPSLGSGGGGCVMLSPDNRGFDPMLLLLVGVSMMGAALARRRRPGQSQTGGI